MKLPATGLTREQIFTDLAELRAGDLATEGGGAFAYVYDPGERAASERAADAYRMFLGSNGLDPTAFPSLLRLENDVVGFAIDHLGGGPGAAGSFTSGGTESLMLAVKTAREWARAGGAGPRARPPGAPPRAGCGRSRPRARGPAPPGPRSPRRR